MGYLVVFLRKVCLPMCLSVGLSEVMCTEEVPVEAKSH